MPESKVADLIIARLDRIEDKVDELKTDFDQRRGIAKGVYFIATGLGTIGGMIGEKIIGAIS